MHSSPEIEKVSELSPILKKAWNVPEVYNIKLGETRGDPYGGGSDDTGMGAYNS